MRREVFIKPPNEFRGMPFWSINDVLDPNEVRAQLRRMVDAGFGGAFFHAREGLATPFLGEDWFKAFEAALEEAKRLRAYLWLYDELRWPSGFGGGIVPARGPDRRAKAIVMVASERAFSGEEVIATFKCRLDERGIPLSYEPAKPGECESGFLYLTFVRYTASIGETWYEGFSYVDLLNPEVVREFIEVAYRPYVERYREEVGKTIPGVFTDEPNIEASRPARSVTMPPRGPRVPPLSLPWTEDLPRKFEELNGYDLIPRLPELFLDLGDYMKTRYDFWRTVTLMFVEAFSKQIFEWCEKYGLKFTGHYLSEDSLLGQLRSSGAVMPHYEYQHIPGIDHLGMHIWGSLLTAKQVASVANQLGRDRVLCETYGCTGNYLTFADRKWIGDFLYALGVNLLNHHLVPYSLRGRRKRDYGLNLHWAQPWWRYNRLIEDYFARLSYVLSRGVRVANILVIHPIGSAWALYTPLNETKVMRLNDKLMWLLRALLKLHLDFELGDELLMAKYAEVEGASLRIGRAKYDVIIVPPSVTLSSTTVKLLEEFVNNGGRVIAVEQAPSRIDGLVDERIRKLFDKAVVVERLDVRELERALNGVSRPIIIRGDPRGDVLYHLRRDGNAMILFLVNTSRNEHCEVEVGVAGSWAPELWDALTGKISSLPARIEGGRTWMHVELPPIGSTLIVMRPGQPARAGSGLEKVKEVEVAGEWRVKRLDPNVVVLDYCRYSIGEGFSETLPLWKAWREIVKRGVGTRFTLRFEFKCDVRPRSALLVAENPQAYKFRINGGELKWVDAGSWLDPSFRMMDVAELLKEGRNTVEVEGVVGLEPEFENLYIVGEFGVEADPGGQVRIVGEREYCKAENLCEEGYPFYAGRMELEREVHLDELAGHRAFLVLEELNAALAIVYVNDVKAGEVFLPPYKVEVTGLLRRGSNKLKIVLVNTLRNILGPLHHKAVDPPFVSPESFIDEASWTDQYVLRPLGFKGIKIEFYETFPMLK
ncbi:MAG: hypothetical protein DRK00_02265 [Thermoprotei archaeon]|nr:MAG: hypothetical protein DRK00_02265 [Thermoprotei archaeon]